MSGRPLIVAIDGPSGVGKSTVARALAERLGVPFLETGAMYRAVGWRVLAEGIDPGDRRRVEELVEAMDLELEPASGGGFDVLLDGRRLTDELRRPEVAAATSIVSTYPGVRAALVERQRSGAGSEGAVLEGRDIGTVVFPDARFKFFLDAAPEIRVARRHRQLSEQARVTRQAAADEVLERDRRDAERVDSPLRCDASYTRIDTGTLTPDEVVERMLAVIGAV